MPKVRIISTTHWTPDDSQGLRRLEQGLALEVDDDTAKRWLRNGIAEKWDGPEGLIDDAHAHASADDLDAEIQRLQALREQRAAFEREQAAAASLPNDQPLYDDGLAKYDFLNETQRVNLRRAGFTDAQRIANARDDELIQVEGIGQSTIDKLRAA